MLPSLGLLCFSWFPLHFQIALGQGHLCLSPTQSPPSLDAVRPPSPTVFSRSSASGSASQVLCSQNVLGSHCYQQGQDTGD